MSANKFLQETVDANKLARNAEELRQIQETREHVEKILRAEFGSEVTIRYGGSKAKGTMILADFDLDLFCYFSCNTTCGDSLEALRTAVEQVLERHYTLERKRTAIRLRSKSGLTNLEVDVVAGRYIDDTKTDVGLFQLNGEKEWMKTNPDIHIDFVKSSEVRDAIILAKIWRWKSGLAISTFILELLVIKLLQDKKGASLDEQMRTLFELIVSDADSVLLKDPANSNNDLSSSFDQCKAELVMAARTALQSYQLSGWKQVFNRESQAQSPLDAILSLAATDVVRVKPYLVQSTPSIGQQTTEESSFELNDAELSEYEELSVTQPLLATLRLTQVMWTLQGLFQLKDEGGAVVARFPVRIEIKREHRNHPPEIFILEDRIPAIADRHVYSNGQCCVEISVASYLRSDRTFSAYLNGPVHSYFVAQAYFELFGTWPHGELAHGIEGVAQFCKQEIGERDLRVVKKLLYGRRRTFDERLNGACYCGSGKLELACHWRSISKLRKWPALAREELRKLVQ